MFGLFGKHNLDENFEAGAGFLDVEVINEHPQYNSTTLDYDFSILTLVADLPFRDSIRDICMPR